MRNPIRFQNVLVGAIVIFIVFKAWWNGMFINLLLATGNSDLVGDPSVSMTGIGGTIFGTLMFIALDAVDFVGKTTIMIFKFIYAVIKDVVMGTKSISDLLKQDEEKPIPVQVTSVNVDAPVTHNNEVVEEQEPEKKAYSDRDILIATYKNTNVLRAEVNTVKAELSTTIDRLSTLEENQ